LLKMVGLCIFTVRSLMPSAAAGLIGKRYFFESSMLLNLSLLRAVVRDVYIPARYPAGAARHLSESRAALQFPWRVLRSFLRRVRLEYFVRDFSAVSLYLVAGLLRSLFGAIWGVWHWFLAAQAGVVASTGTVMIAVLPIIVGVQLLLQALTLDIHNVPGQPMHRTARLVMAERRRIARP
jgi:dolichol-phosphate mannosyltransferase